MKKYYFNSIMYSLIYIIISIVFVSMAILCLFADDLHSGVIFVIVFSSISAFVTLFWSVFSFSMRIQIDYINKELYIIHPCFIRKIKFEDIISIEIIDYNEVAFEFNIITAKHSKKIPYARYLNKRPNEKIKMKLDELKSDLMKISDMT